MSQPSLPGQYGYPPASGHPTGSAGSNGLWTDPRQGYGASGRPQEGLQGGYGGYGGHGAQGQASPAGYGQTPARYSEYSDYGGYSAHSQYAASGALPAGSTGLPPAGAPIPVTQESVVFRASATSSARISMIALAAFGLFILAGAIYNLIDTKFLTGILLLLLSMLLFAMVAFLMSVRTTLDATGIHIGTATGARDFPWPESRTGMFVQIKIAGGKAALIANSANTVLVTPEGKPVILAGLTWMGPLPNRLEAKGMAELDRIWAWAVARGYTRETGQYTELNVHGPRRLIQIQRRHQEERYGLV